MREGWTYKKLGEVCEIFDSQRKPVTKSNRKSGCYPYYGATGVQDYVDSYLFDGRYLLIGEDGAKWGAMDNSAYIIEGQSWVNNHVHILQTKNDAIDKYLMYYLNYSDLDKYISGAIVRKLTQASLREIQIPLPPTPQQEAIVSELDEINSLLDLKREQLQTYDKLAQSLFYEMFGDPVENEKGWEVRSLSELCSLLTDGTHQTPTYTDDTINGVKFLSAKDVTSGRIDWSNIKYIPFDLHQELHKRLAPQRNDILLCKNGTTGICALVETDEIFDIYVSLALLRLKEDILPKYIVCAINHPETKYQFDRSLKGIGVPNLHLGEIKKAKINLPPLPLQQQFASRIEQIEEQKKQVTAAIKRLETLLASRMQYWFE